MNKRILLGKCPLDVIHMGALLPALDGIVAAQEPKYACFLEGHTLSRAQRDMDLQEIYSKAAFVLPDGIATVIGARLFGQQLPSRITASDLLLSYCDYGIKSEKKHFFYGGGPGVADQLAMNLKRMFPGIHIAGTYSPPFQDLSEEQRRQIFALIEASGAEVVWVGLGAPKQERWMAEACRQLKVPLLLGIGVTFDYFACTRSRAPKYIRAIGMEWAYRMATGGRRVFYRNAKHCFLTGVLLAGMACRQYISTVSRNKT
jgi:N-acetylglucosaminyldiphosphoundecaprenol N-acetyl-beta-D-mannosaminyltransferase